MQKSPLINRACGIHYIPISASRRCSDNVLVKRKWYEHDDNQQIDNGANGTHRLGYLLLVLLAHILAFHPGFHKCWAQPSYHRICRRKGNATECQRGNERLAIAVEGVRNYANASNGERQETEGFGKGEVGRQHCRRFIACTGQDDVVEEKRHRMTRRERGILRLSASRPWRNRRPITLHSSLQYVPRASPFP